VERPVVALTCRARPAGAIGGLAAGLPNAAVLVPRRRARVAVGHGTAEVRPRAFAAQSGRTAARVREAIGRRAATGIARRRARLGARQRAHDGKPVHHTDLRRRTARRHALWGDRTTYDGWRTDRAHEDRAGRRAAICGALTAGLRRVRIDRVAAEARITAAVSCTCIVSPSRTACARARRRTCSGCVAARSCVAAAGCGRCAARASCMSSLRLRAGCVSSLRLRASCLSGLRLRAGRTPVQRALTSGRRDRLRGTARRTRGE
jgi:hypothetical protein